MKKPHILTITGLFIAFSMGCCAGPRGVACRSATRRHARGPIVAADDCTSCQGPVLRERVVHTGPPSSYRGPLSWLFDALAVGYVCEDCGDRYWGDWGGDSAACETCDEYGNWTGRGTGRMMSMATRQPVSSDCPTCTGNGHDHSPVPLDAQANVIRAEEKSPQPTPAEPKAEPKVASKSSDASGNRTARRSGSTTR